MARTPTSLILLVLAPTSGQIQVLNECVLNECMSEWKNETMADSGSLPLA